MDDIEMRWFEEEKTMKTKAKNRKKEKTVKNHKLIFIVFKNNKKINSANA